MWFCGRLVSNVTDKTSTLFLLLKSFSLVNFLNVFSFDRNSLHLKFIWNLLAIMHICIIVRIFKRNNEHRPVPYNYLLTMCILHDYSWIFCSCKQTHNLIYANDVRHFKNFSKSLRNCTGLFSTTFFEALL